MSQTGPSPKIKSKATTYEYGLDAIKQLFANNLNVPVEQVKLHFKAQEVGDERMGRYKEICGVEITVDETAEAQSRQNMQDR